MHIIACQIQLGLDGVHSLKEKRHIVKSVTKRISNQFNVAISEVDHHDVWQSAILGVAAVGSDRSQLHAVMEKVVSWIERNRPDLYIVQYETEFR